MKTVLLTDKDSWEKNIKGRNIRSQKNKMHIKVKTRAYRTLRLEFPIFF